MRALLAGIIVAVLLLAGALALMPGAMALQAQPGAYVDQINWFAQRDQSLALKQIASGEMDLYQFPLRTITDIQSAKSNPNVRTLDVPGSINNLFLNPVPINQTKAPNKLNPFSVREVREAMNYLLDRKFIVDQIYGGASITHTTLFYSQDPEYGRDAVYFTQKDRAYAYNPDTALALIGQGMAQAGATQVNGQWMYAGAPVNINLVQRTEDSRFQIGAYVADRLKAAGFQVTLIPKSGGGAFAIVYNGPPDGGAWQAYTEGWATTGLTAWSDGSPQFFFDGGEGSQIWNYYKPDTFPVGSPERQMGDVAQKLFFSSYTSLAEREQLIEQAVDLTLKNSVRVWLVAGAVFAMSSTRLPTPGVGFVYDLAGGPWSYFSTRTARLTTQGGTLNVGQRLMFLSDWNPWRGFGWLYDGLQANTFQDLALWSHPHTGLNIPVRADFAVSTAGPFGKLSVPPDAIIWKNSPASFVPVGQGVQATSKVLFTFTFGKWHDGQAMDMNDVLHEISLWGRMAPGGDIYTHDNDGQNTGTLLFNQIVKGYRATGANTLEVYGNFWHVDPSSIAFTLAGETCGGSGCTSIFPTAPWQVAELAMAPVLADKVAISPDTASNKGVDGLDFARGATTIAAMDASLQNYTTANHKAPGMGTLISDTEAQARWAALPAFRTARGHFFVSNGPFVLSKVDIAHSQTTMTRFADYPFMSDRWDYLLVPKIPKTEIQTPQQVILGTGLPANVTVKATLGTSPYDNLDMSWLLSNPSTGAVLFSGTAVKVGAGLFNVTMTPGQLATIEPGAYTLTTVTVGHEAAIPVTSSTSIVAISVLTKLEQLLAQQTAGLQTQINDLTGKLTKAQTDATNAQTLANNLLIALVIAIVVAILAIAVSAVSIRNTNRRFAQLGTTMGAMPAQMEDRRP